MKLRDLVIVVSLIALVALFLSTQQEPPRQEVVEESQEQKLKQALPETNESRDILSHREARTEPVVETSKDQSFRIKRLTASMLADNVADEEKAAIAGYVIDTIDVSKALVDPTWSSFNIDGIGLDTYSEEQLEQKFGTPDFRSSSAHFGDSISWVQLDGRRLVATELSGPNKLKVTSITGHRLYSGSKLLFKARKSEDIAVKLLGLKQRAPDFVGVGYLGGRKTDDDRYIGIGVQAASGLIKSITLTEYKFDPKTNKTI